MYRLSGAKYIETAGTNSTVPGAMVKITFQGDGQTYKVTVTTSTMWSQCGSYSCLCRYKTCDFALSWNLLDKSTRIKAVTYDVSTRKESTFSDVEEFLTDGSWIDRLNVSAAASIQCLKGESLMMDVVDSDSATITTHTLNTHSSPVVTGNKLLKFFPWCENICEVSHLRNMHMKLYRIPLEFTYPHAPLDTCVSLDHMAEVNLTTYFNRLHPTWLPVRMRAEMLDIPLAVLPPDVYVMCLHIVSYTFLDGAEPSVVCGKFTKNTTLNETQQWAAAPNFLLRGEKSPKADHFSWPVTESLVLDVSNIYHLFETEDSGYRGASSLQYTWFSEPNSYPGSSIPSCLKLPITLPQTAGSKIEIAANSVSHGPGAYCVTCNITAGVGVDHITRRVVFNVQFVTSSSPYIEMKCLSNCYSELNPSIPMLLKVDCPTHCDGYDPANIRVDWTIQSVPSTGSLYKTVDIESFRSPGDTQIVAGCELSYSTSTQNYTGRAFRVFQLSEVAQTHENVDYILTGKVDFERCSGGYRCTEVKARYSWYYSRYIYSRDCFSRHDQCKKQNCFSDNNPNGERFCFDDGNLNVGHLPIPTAYSFFVDQRDFSVSQKISLHHHGDLLRTVPPPSQQPGVDTLASGQRYNHVSRVTIHSTEPGKEYVLSRSLVVPSRIVLGSQLAGRLHVTKSTATGQTVSKSTSVTGVETADPDYSDSHIQALLKECLEGGTYHDSSCLLHIASTQFKEISDSEKYQLIANVTGHLKLAGNIHYGNVDATLHMMEYWYDYTRYCAIVTTKATHDSSDVPSFLLIATARSIMKSVGNEPFEDSLSIYRRMIDIIDAQTKCFQKIYRAKPEALVQEEYRLVTMKYDLLNQFCNMFPRENETRSLDADSSKSMVKWLNPFTVDNDLELLSARIRGDAIRQEVSYNFYDPFFTIVTHKIEYSILSTEDIFLPPVLVQLAEKIDELGRKTNQTRQISKMYNLDFSLKKGIFAKGNSHTFNVKNPGTSNDCILFEVLKSEEYSTLLHITSGAYSSVIIRSQVDDALKDMLALRSNDNAKESHSPLHLLEQFTQQQTFDHNKNARYHVMAELSGGPTTASGADVEVNCARIRCASWNALDYRWSQDSCRAEENNGGRTDVISCSCDRGSLFSAGRSSCLVTRIDVDALNVIGVDLRLDNFYGAILVFGILIVAAYLWYWACYNDNRTRHLRQAHTVGYTNFQSDQYLICFDSLLTTTSTVSIVLIGKLRVSRKIALFGTGNTFLRGTETWIFVTARYTLGRIRNILLSVDLKGTHPRWKCSRVFVRHINSGESFYCDLKDKEVPDESNLNIPYTINLLQKSPKDGWKQSFLRIMAKYHIVISILFGKSAVNHTRITHCLVATCSLLTTMLLVMAAIYIEFKVPQQRLITEYEGHGRIFPQNRVLRATLYASLMAAPLCSFIGWIVARSRPRRHVVFDPHPKIAGPCRRNVWYPRTSLPEELPPLSDGSEDNTRSNLLSPIGSEVDPPDQYPINQSKNVPSTDRKKASEPSDRKKVSEPSDRKKASEPTDRKKASEPTDRKILEPDAHKTRESSDNKDSSPTNRGRSEPSGRKQTSASKDPKKSPSRDSMMSEPNDGHRDSIHSYRSSLLDDSPPSSVLDSPPSSVFYTPRGSIYSEDSDTQHQEEQTPSDDPTSPEPSKVTKPLRNIDRNVKSSKTDKNISHNASSRRKEEEIPVTMGYRHDSQMYEFTTVKEVPLERYTEPEDTAQEIEEQHDKRIKQCCSFTLDSHIVCFLLMLVIFLETVLVLSCIAMCTKEESKLFLEICLYSFLLLFFGLQPIIFAIAAASSKARLSLERESTADEYISSRKREMMNGLTGLRHRWQDGKKFIGSHALHWRRKYSSGIIMKRYNRKISESDNVSENNNINLLLLMLLFLVVFLLTNFQAGFINRNDQNTFNMDFLNLKSNLDDPVRIGQFWSRIQDVYAELRQSNSQTHAIVLLSSIRLRQMRTIPQVSGCTKFEKYVHPLCKRLGDREFDTQTYVGSWNAIPDYNIPFPTPFTYTPTPSWDDLDIVGDRVSTDMNDYPSGGYDYLLPLESDDKDLFRRLEVLGWLDDRTQLVRLDFTVYMPDTHLATSVVVTYEFSPIAIFRESFVYTYFLKDDFRDDIRLYSIICLGILVLFLVKQQLTFTISNGFKRSVTSQESVVRTVEILLTILTIAVWAIGDIWRDDNLEHLQKVYRERAELTSYVNFRYLANWDRDVAVPVQVTLFVVILLHLLVETNRFPLLSDLAYITYHMGLVIIFPIAVVVLFEMPGKLLFQTRYLGFSKDGELLNAFKIMMWPYYALPDIRNDPPISPDFIALVYFCMAKSVYDFICLNLFIAVITDLIERRKMETARQAEVLEREKAKHKGKEVSLMSRIMNLFTNKTEVDSYHGPRRYSRPRRSPQANVRFQYQNQFFYR